MSYQAVASGDADGDGGPKPTILSIKVEKIRFIAYLSFWGMCGFAIICSNVLVWPDMTCTIDGVDSVGKDCTDLMRVFGFNNVSLSDSR